MLRHVPKSICSPPLNFVAYKSCLSQGNVVKPWICQQCRLQCQSPRPGLVSASLKLKTRSSYNTIRVISTSQSNESSNGEDAAMFKERKELPSQEEGRRSHISKRFSHVMDHLQSNIFIAGQRLNDLTGYSGIEALKKDIEEQGRSFHRPHQKPHTDVKTRADCADKPHLSSTGKGTILDGYCSTLRIPTRGE